VICCAAPLGALTRKASTECPFEAWGQDFAPGRVHGGGSWGNYFVPVVNCHDWQLWL
jgi:hypothetical protein